MHIGITIGLRTPDESLWINGIKQNALFLAKLFQLSPFGHQVTLLNTTDVEITDQVCWDRSIYQTQRLDDNCSSFDVVIELGGQIGPEQTIKLKRAGTKLVSYCCGPEYVQNIESMIFRRPLWNELFVNQHYDELWLIPQIYELNRGFLSTLRRCQVQKVPFVWDPMTLETETSSHANKGQYMPTSGAKRLTIIEPNIDVLKFCLYPIMIAERAFRIDPDSIEFLHVANSTEFAVEGREFAKLMSHLDIVKSQKASFIGRVETPHFLAKHTDIVISHQWGLPLNYLYLECCWLGYPLIHNADEIKDLGFYYNNHDLEDATQKLLSVLRNHDICWNDYMSHQRSTIERYLASNADLIAQYDELLFRLVNRH
jgi:hypothetical protein